MLPCEGYECWLSLCSSLLGGAGWEQRKRSLVLQASYCVRSKSKPAVLAVLTQPPPSIPPYLTLPRPCQLFVGLNIHAHTSPNLACLAGHKFCSSSIQEQQHRRDAFQPQPQAQAVSVEPKTVCLLTPAVTHEGVPAWHRALAGPLHPPRTPTGAQVSGFSPTHNLAVPPATDKWWAHSRLGRTAIQHLSSKLKMGTYMVGVPWGRM